MHEIVLPDQVISDKWDPANTIEWPITTISLLIKFTLKYTTLQNELKSFSLEKEKRGSQK